jgi:hypothetical protein
MVTRVRLTLALVSALTLGTAARAATAAPAPATCSEGAAIAAATPLHLVGEPSIAHPVSVFCGAFLGRGSHAMVVTFNRGVCLPNFGWAVFRDAGGTWKLLDPPGDVIHVVYPPLRAVGDDIREEWAVFRRGDGECFPSGGTRVRLWHWNGSRLVAGPSRQGQPPSGRPRPSLRIGAFVTPSRNIVCQHITGAKSRPRSSVFCGIRSGLKPPPRRRSCHGDGDYVHDRVALFGRGRPFAPVCAGDAGPFAVLFSGQHVPVLHYGKRWRGGGLTCRSAFKGLTCHNRAGHGFFLSRSRWRRF